MKRTSNVVWGIILVVAGMALAMNAFGITDINLFFDGWWTLFIIIPCGVGLISDRDKGGNLIGLCVGVILFLCCRDIFRFDIVWKMLLPLIIKADGIWLAVPLAEFLSFLVAIGCIIKYRKEYYFTLKR